MEKIVRQMEIPVKHIPGCEGRTGTDGEGGKLPWLSGENNLKDKGAMHGVQSSRFFTSINIPPALSVYSPHRPRGFFHIRGMRTHPVRLVRGGYHVRK